VVDLNSEHDAAKVAPFHGAKAIGFKTKGDLGTIESGKLSRFVILE